MPIAAFLTGKSFDPETIEIMNVAFVAVCVELGLSDKTDGACELVAERVVALADGRCSPDELRVAVLASLRGAS